MNHIIYLDLTIGNIGSLSSVWIISKTWKYKMDLWNYVSLSLLMCMEEQKKEWQISSVLKWYYYFNKQKSIDLVS